MLSSHQSFRALRLYSQVQKQVAKAEQILLELCRHPDATDAHIREAVEAYKRIHTGLHEIKPFMRKAGLIHYV